MIQRFMGYFFGKIKLVLFKMIYPNRIKLNKKIKFNNKSNLYIDKKSKVILGESFKCRKNMSIWAVDQGIVSIGNNVFINDNCVISCHKKITIGDNFQMGNNSSIYDNDHDYKKSNNDFISEEVVIGNNVWIGANVVILKGVKIGDNSVIAAGTIVNKDIPKNSMIYQKRELVIKKK